MGRAVQVDFLLAGLRDSNGNALASGKVYHYIAGTTSDKDLYSAYDKSGTVAQPLVLDSNGKASAWADGAYKFVIKDSSDNTLYTHDNLFYEYDDGVSLYGGTTTGAANTYAASVSPSISAYVTGQRFSALLHQTNTSTTPTIAFNGLATKTIVNSLGGALFPGEMQNGALADFVYDGTNMRLLPAAPRWAAWTPTFTGFSADPAGGTYRFIVVGKLCVANVYMPNTGTSNSVNFTMTAPLTAGTPTIQGTTTYDATDNGAGLSSPARVLITGGTATFTLNKTLVGGSWTNANGKAASFSISYEIA